jgi:SnoaL-like domain
VEGVVVPTIEELAAEVLSLRRRVEASEAVLEIQALKARYGDLVDQRFASGGIVDDAELSRIVDEVAALFTVDATWDGGPGLGSVTGRPAIAERLRRPTLNFSRHLFVKPRIEVEGGRARARWDLLSPCRRLDGSSYWMCGYEDDEYLRVDGAWLHSSMKLTTVFMAPVGEGWTKILA